MTLIARRVVPVLALTLLLGGLAQTMWRADAASLPFGTAVQNAKVDGSCPAGSTCVGFNLTCPGSSKSPSFFLSHTAATAATHGTVVLVSDTSGTAWWLKENPEAAALLTSWADSGLQVVQLRFSSAWTTAPTGTSPGAAALACRPATAIRTAYERYHAPLNLEPTVGSCGFCVAGNGVGASSIAYALSHYGQGSVIDGAVMMGGPIHGALAKSCGSDPGEAPYHLSQGARSAIDRMYGITDGTGPCVTSDPGYVSRWTDDAIATGGNDFDHPSTGITFLFGQQDTTAQAIAGDYEDALANAGTPAQSSIIPNGTTRITRTEAGRAALDAALNSGDPTPSPSSSPTPSPSSSPTPSSSPSPSGTPAASPSPSSSPSPGGAWTWPYTAPAVNPGMPLGTVTPTGAQGGCPTGVPTCLSYDVSCPGLPAPGKLVTGVSPAVGTPKAVLVLFSGGAGGQWWSGINEDTAALLPQVQATGYTVVQVKWIGGVFSGSANGGDHGPAKILCRSATAARFIHDYVYAPLDIHPSAPGKCGFCMSGNSGGSNQTSYMLSHYGLDGIIDAQIPSGGPPYGTLVKSCLGEDAFAFGDDDTKVLDTYYGFPIGSNGPCVSADPAFTSRWTEDAVATGGNDYTYPNTRVHFLMGATDKRMLAIGKDWYNRAVAEGSPLMTWQVIPGAGHTLWSSQQGLDAWMQVLANLQPA